MVNSLVGAFRGNASFRPRAEPRDKQRTEGDDAKWYCELDESGDGSSPNGRFLRHRFSPKPEVIATANSLPKRNHAAKEAVSAARQTKTRLRSERICKSNDAPRAKPRPCVKTMLCGWSELTLCLRDDLKRFRHGIAVFVDSVVVFGPNRRPPEQETRADRA